MNYCTRCLYPRNSKPYIIFDEEGICSGCRYIESRAKIDWEAKKKQLADLLLSYKCRDNIYDCIIPVSGGKDSHYQVYLIKEVYKLNPLLVTYNHTFNTALGLRNLTNLVKVFNCDLIRYTTNPKSARKLSRYMLKKIGDITWHYHAGIMTFPIQIAVKYKIPLIIWGEEGFSELVGMHNQDDMVEFTKKKRQEHSMRGFEPEDILKDPIAIKEGITVKDLAPFIYPTNEEIEGLWVRGIYLSNYINWNAKKQTELMIEKYGFETAYSKDRTFNIYDKTDDIHASGLHDYLKYLKFGYGRATDDASTEIRHGRMSREKGIEMVMKYDHIRPKDMDLWLKFANMTEDEFMSYIDPLRDFKAWERINGQWVLKDNIGNHINEPCDRVHYVGKGDFIKRTKDTKSLNEQEEYKIL
mgnify:FL=1